MHIIFTLDKYNNPSLQICDRNTITNRTYQLVSYTCSKNADLQEEVYLRVKDVFMQFGFLVRDKIATEKKYDFRTERWIPKKQQVTHLEMADLIEKFYDISNPRIKWVIEFLKSL